MSLRELRRRAVSDSRVSAVNDEELSYALLEEARLLCEQLKIEDRAECDRLALHQVHPELGMAGWLASSHMDHERRLALLESAHQQSTTAMMLHPTESTDALVGAAVLAEDVLADLDQSEHMHLAHLHLLSAMELLAGHL